MRVASGVVCSHRRGARASIAVFQVKTYVVKHILKFNICLKSEHSYHGGRAPSQAVNGMERSPEQAVHSNN